MPRSGEGTGFAELRVTCDSDRRVWFSGLMRCGSVWSCPECAAQVARGRIAQLRGGMLKAAALGWGACWQTLTLPHDAPDRLADSLRLIAEGWRWIQQRHGWRKLRRRLEVVGTVRKVEVTHGANGWHPHCHLTYFTRRPLSEGELEELEGFVWSAWVELVTSMGYRSPRRELCPIAFLSLEDRAIADYIGKVLALELAGQEKRSRALVGRMPFELLEAACAAFRDNPALRQMSGLVVDYSTGELRLQDDVRLWREYERATKGKHQLHWSRVVRRELGIAELSDTELLELGEALAAQESEPVYRFVRAEWRAVWATPGALRLIMALAREPSPVAERAAAIGAQVAGWVTAITLQPVA